MKSSNIQLIVFAILMCIVLTSCSGCKKVNDEIRNPVKNAISSSDTPTKSEDESKLSSSNIPKKFIDTLLGMSNTEFQNSTECSNFFSFNGYVLYDVSKRSENSESRIMLEMPDGTKQELLRIDEFIMDMYWVNRYTIGIAIHPKINGNYLALVKHYYFFNLQTGEYKLADLKYPLGEDAKEMYGENIWYRGNRFVKTQAKNAENDAEEDIYIQNKNSQFKLLAQTAHVCYFSDETMFYINNDSNIIYSTDFLGEDNKKIHKSSHLYSSDFAVKHGRLIETGATNQSSNIIDLNTGKTTELEGDYANVYAQIEEEGIYIVNFDKGLQYVPNTGTVKTLVAGFSYYKFRVIGEWIYYENLIENENSYEIQCFKMKLDGSGLTSL